MTLLTKGMGVIMKSKMKKAGVKKPTFPGPRTIDLLNREIKKKIEQEPAELERYTDLMVSDFETKTGPFFEKIRAREKAKAKAAELKKLKGKK